MENLSCKGISVNYHTSILSIESFSLYIVVHLSSTLFWASHGGFYHPTFTTFYTLSSSSLEICTCAAAKASLTWNIDKYHLYCTTFCKGFRPTFPVCIALSAFLRWRTETLMTDEFTHYWRFVPVKCKMLFQYRTVYIGSTSKASKQTGWFLVKAKS